jgi:hypothetical protein
VAAAGNPNIVEELLAGKDLGGKTYKVHLDGYNQLDFITGNGPTKRNEIFYFCASATTNIALPTCPAAGSATQFISIGRC